MLKVALRKSADHMLLFTAMEPDLELGNASPRNFPPSTSNVNA